MIAMFSVLMLVFVQLDTYYLVMSITEATRRPTLSTPDNAFEMHAKAVEPGLARRAGKVAIELLRSADKIDEMHRDDRKDQQIVVGKLVLWRSENEKWVSVFDTNPRLARFIKPLLDVQASLRPNFPEMRSKPVRLTFYTHGPRSGWNIHSDPEPAQRLVLGLLGSAEVSVWPRLGAPIRFRQKPGDVYALRGNQETGQTLLHGVKKVSAPRVAMLM